MTMPRVPASLVILKVPAGAAVPRLWKVTDRVGTLVKRTPGGRDFQLEGSL